MIPELFLFVLLFILGIGYYHGLKWFFRYNFRWSYAATCGIVVVVCLTASFIWIPRYGYDIAVEIVISLVFPFAGALYWMLRFGRLLKADREQEKEDWNQIIKNR